jgi:hypothetical protein
MSYDSRPDTYAHIDAVRALMTLAIHDLIERARVHDASKLQSPEVEAFDVISPRLHGVTYGSEDYKATMREFKPALDHHVTQNTHHPEAHANGVHGMSVLDLLEMCCDWIAASRRHADGDVLASLDINAERFGYGDELKTTLRNTITAILEAERAS